MIKVNGEIVDIAPGGTVVELLAALGYPDKFIAVECDGEIVPRAKYGERVVADGAVLEVVRFVGGG